MASRREHARREYPRAPRRTRGAIDARRANLSRWLPAAAGYRAHGASAGAVSLGPPPRAVDGGSVALPRDTGLARRPAARARPSGPLATAHRPGAGPADRPP